MGTREAKFAKKNLGQNFLKDPGVLHQIIMAAGELKGVPVLEIGPGFGVLTDEIVAAGGNVTAIELDKRLYGHLEKRYAGKSFTLVKGSVLDTDIDALWEGKPMYKVVANIPYHITGPILRKLLEETEHKAERCVLMVQKEVAKKIVDQKKRSILSVSVEVWAEASLVCVVPRTAFDPAPKVDSGVVCLQMREFPLVQAEDLEVFFTVVNAGFSQKRKKLQNGMQHALGIDKEKLEEILGDIDGGRRAETLSVEEWYGIAKRYKNVQKEA